MGLKCKGSNENCEVCRRRGKCEILAAYEEALNAGFKLQEEKETLFKDVSSLKAEIQALKNPKAKPEAPAQDAKTVEAA